MQSTPSLAGLDGASRFRIANMDCASEESEIRRAVASIDGIRGLKFQLGQRSLTIDAPAAAVAQALAAIRKAGFDPQPVSTAAPRADVAAGTPAEQLHAADNDHGHDHDSGGIRRLVLALSFAIAAEAVGFFAPDT
jgi:Cd2+/Zn2+-exporting ATPase